MSGSGPWLKRRAGLVGVVTACWLAVLLIVVARAGASVVIDNTQIRVSGPDASAVITRSPFGVAFFDRAGRQVLAGSGGTPSPLVVPPLPQSDLLGENPAKTPTLYAPLTFLVGEHLTVGEPASEWEGNLIGTVESGVEYSAHGAIAVARQGQGVRVTVSTNDPTGRLLYVTVAPGKAGTITVSVRPSDATGIVQMGDSFHSSAGEAFHGFGGRHDGLDQHGQDFYNYLQQENVGAGEAQPVATGVQGSAGNSVLFPNGPLAAYYVSSAFVSNAGYGFLLDRNELSRWRLDSDRPDAWKVSVAGAGIDYMVAPGDMAHAIGAISAITGRQRVPPSWGSGPLLDRLVQYPNESATHYFGEVQDDIANIKRYHLPLEGYRIEGWRYLTDAQLSRVITELRSLGVHPMVYFRAFVGQDRIGTDDPAAFNTAVQHGYVATTATGAPYIFISNFQEPAAVIDFTNPAAVSWWQGRLRAALTAGADGFMQDFGEQVLPDMHFHDGQTGATMHNRFPVLYDQATRELFDRYERRHPRRQLFFFTRAGYSGTPGNAAYENANFPGDETTDWSRSSGLGSQTPDMLNRAVGGAYGFGTDIGGYTDAGPYAPTTKELFLRWAEWAALTPVFRLHGSVVAGTHTPWSYDRQAVEIYSRLSRLHLKALPLILSLWRQADRTGIPPTRPLYLAYPEDPRAVAQDQEWLLGPDVLVAPVVAQGATTRTVYFPRGCWRDPETGERYRGPRDAGVAAPLAKLPYFLRCGTHPFSPPRGPRRAHR